ALIVVVASVILTFLPIHFLHPVRVQRLRPVNLAVFFLWCALGGYALLKHFDIPDWVSLAFVATGIYLYGIGAVLQFFPSLGKSKS
ncbi:MAG: phosphatidylcholine synthase, partial [Rhizobium sp.]|nr:phosphatidylcholine synthase [Rhizobium sp.]